MISSFIHFLSNFPTRRLRLWWAVEVVVQGDSLKPNVLYTYVF